MNDPRDRDGSFAVRGTAEPGGMVRPYEDGTCVGTDEADATTGERSVSLVNVSGGTRTYKARATDASGNVSEDSDGVAVVVDKTALTVSATTPTGKTVPRTANVTATFSEGTDEASIDAVGTVKLAMKGKKGATTPVAATVCYDPNRSTQASTLRARRPTQRP